MKERGILFSAPMVRAILDGAKTQTRRIVKPRDGLEYFGGKGDEDDPECWGTRFDGPDHHGYAVLARGRFEHHDHGCVSIPCPYGEVGDRLWVRETWGVSAIYDGVKPGNVHPGAKVAFWATDQHVGVKVRQSIFMPRWASRITLEVTDVRVQRLNAISEEDAKGEGVKPEGWGGDAASGRGHTLAFAYLWNEINGGPTRDDAPPGLLGGAWAENPWVWAVSFKRVDVGSSSAAVAKKITPDSHGGSR